MTLTKKRTKSRKDKLKELYKNCKKDIRDWSRLNAEIEAREDRDFNSMKLCLYYLQQGHCMYTDEPIDLDKLMSANSSWDRDHIYPQSRIKDDSLDNLVLVKNTLNREKSNKLITADIRSKMKSRWKLLYEQGFMSKKKFDRLMRSQDFTDAELSGFIERQIVQTRQSPEY